MLGRLPALTWVTVVAYLCGGVFLVAIAFSDRLYQSQGQPWVAAGGVGLMLFPAAVVLRGRETITHTLLQSLYTVCLCVVCGLVAVDGRIGTTIATTIGMVTLGGAMRMPRAHVWWLLGVAQVASLLVILRSGLDGVQLVAVTGMVSGLTCIPGLTVMHYRRQLEGALRQVKDLATTDALTGLINRRGLLERTPLLFAEAVRADRLIAVLMADVDHFKKLNDARGHLAGDDVLRSISQIVETSMRGTDVVARFGGEELCMVTVLDQETELGAIAERVRGNVEAGTDGVTISIGAVTCRPDRAVLPTDGLLAMINAADRLLYDAKEAGRNAVRVAAV